MVSNICHCVPHKTPPRAPQQPSHRQTTSFVWHMCPSVCNVIHEAPHLRPQSPPALYTASTSLLPARMAPRTNHRCSEVQTTRIQHNIASLARLWIYLHTPKAILFTSLPWFLSTGLNGSAFHATPTFKLHIFIREFTSRYEYYVYMSLIFCKSRLGTCGCIHK